MALSARVKTQTVNSNEPAGRSDVYSRFRGGDIEFDHTHPSAGVVPIGRVHRRYNPESSNGENNSITFPKGSSTNT